MFSGEREETTNTHTRRANFRFQCSPNAPNSIFRQFHCSLSFGKSERSSSKEFIHHKSSDFRAMPYAYEIYIEKETSSTHTRRRTSGTESLKCGSNCFQHTKLKKSNIKHVIHNRGGFLYARCGAKRKTFYRIFRKKRKKTFSLYLDVVNEIQSTTYEKSIDLWSCPLERATKHRFRLGAATRQ